MSRFPVILSHGAAHLTQQPRSDVPARTHGSTSSTGNVAKWASGNGVVAMVQTDRLFLVSRIARKVCSTLASDPSRLLPAKSPFATSA